MQLSRLASRLIYTVPIEHAIRRVTVLLDLDKNVSSAHGVKSPRRQKHCVAGFNTNRVDIGGSRTIAQRFLKLIAADGFAESNEKFGVRFGGCDIPRFRF